MGFVERIDSASDSPENHTGLVADMLSNGIYQYDTGQTSSKMRDAFTVIDKLLSRGLICKDEIYTAKLGALSAILLQETANIDIGEDLTSHITLEEF